MANTKCANSGMFNAGTVFFTSASESESASDAAPRFTATKVVAESETASDALAKAFTKILTDSNTPTVAAPLSPGKRLSESETPSAALGAFTAGKFLAETETMSTAVVAGFTKLLLDNQFVSDQRVMSPGKPLAETIRSTDWLRVTRSNSPWLQDDDL